MFSCFILMKNKMKSWVVLCCFCKSLQFSLYFCWVEFTEEKKLMTCSYRMFLSFLVLMTMVNYFVRVKMQRKNAVEKKVSHLIAAWWSVQKTTSLKKTIRWWDDGFLWRLISVYLVAIMIMISLQEAFTSNLLTWNINIVGFLCYILGVSFVLCIIYMFMHVSII